MAMSRRRLSGWSGLVVGAVLVIIGWVFFVLVSARPELRFIVDLTPNQSATVTAPTKQLIGGLAKLDARVEIAKYYQPPRSVPNPNRQYRAGVSIHNRIKSLTDEVLRQYAALGGDRMQVIDCNPRLYPERAREWRERVAPMRRNHVLVVAVFRPDGNGGESVRSVELVINEDLAAIDRGPMANVPGSQNRLPTLEKYLGEAAITSAIKSLLESGTPTVYLIDGHRGGMAGRQGPRQVHNLVGALQEHGFKVSTINLGDEEIPESATILASFEPESEFTEAEGEKLLEFLRDGGRVFFNVSYVPYKELRQAKFLGKVGLQIGTELVAQVWENAPVSKSATLEIKSMNSNHAITRSLFQDRRSLGMREAVPISRLEPIPDGVSVDTTFLRTDARCWLMPHGLNNLQPPRGKQYYSAHSVGALVTVESGKQHPGKLVVVSGGMLRNSMSGDGSQMDFGLNCFEWLAERQLNVRIDKRAAQVQMIDLGTNEDEKAARLSLAMWTQVVITPLMFLVLGLFVGWRRRRI